MELPLSEEFTFKLNMEFILKYGIYLEIWYISLNMELTFKYGIYLKYGINL